VASVTSWEFNGDTIATGGGSNVRFNGRPIRKQEMDMVDGSVFSLAFADGDSRYDQPIILECDFHLLSTVEYMRFRLWHDLQLEFTLETGLLDAEKAECVCLDTTYKVYYGPHRPWKSGSVTVYVEGVEVSSDDYALDLDAGTITFDSALTSSDDVTVDYIHYPTMVFADFQGTMDTPSTYTVPARMVEVR